MPGIGPITNLPALPSPTAGIQAGGSMAGLAQGAGAIEEQINERKAKDRQEAIQKLPMLTQMLRAQPTNKQLEAEVARTASIAGIPVPWAQNDQAQQPIKPSFGGPAPGPATGGGVGITPPPPRPAAPQIAGQQPPPGAQQPPEIGRVQAKPWGPPSAGTATINPGTPNLATPDSTAPTHPPPLGADATPQQQAHHGFLSQIAEKMGLAPHPDANHTPAQNPGQHIDTDVLSPRPAPSESQLQYLLEQPPGPTRAAIARTMGVAVDQETLNNLPARFVPGTPGYRQAWTELEQLNLRAAQGNFTADQVESAYKQHAEQFAMAGISMADVSPAVVANISRNALTEIQRKEALGAKYAAETTKALADAKTLPELRAAQMAHLEAQTKAIPEKLKLEIQIEQRRAQDSAKSFGLKVQQLKILKQRADQGDKVANSQLIGMVKFGQSSYKAAEANLEKLHAAYAHLTQDLNLHDDLSDPAHPDVSPEVQTVKDDIARAEQDVKDARDIQTQVNQEAGSASGITSALHSSGMSSSSSVKPAPPKASDLTPVEKYKGNQKVTIYRDKNGKWYDENKQPL